MSLELTSILLVKLEIFVQVELSKTSQEFFVTIIAPIKLAKYIQLRIRLKNSINFFITLFKNNNYFDYNKFCIEKQILLL
jgi:hypothetical protein